MKRFRKNRVALFVSVATAMVMNTASAVERVKAAFMPDIHFADIYADFTDSTLAKQTVTDSTQFDDVFKQRFGGLFGILTRFANGESSYHFTWTLDKESIVDLKQPDLETGMALKTRQ